MTQPDLSRLRIDRERPSNARSHRPRWPLYVALAALAVAAAVFFLVRRGSRIPIEVARADVRGAGSGTTGITANGYVVARTKASVAPKIMGRLEYLGVAEGSSVRKGEVIARLENRDYLAALAQREAELATAEAALEEVRAQHDQLERDVRRANELAPQGLISSQEAERVVAQFDAAGARVRLTEAQMRAVRAAVEAARANLENTNIRAPFDGTVLRKDAEVGEVVAPAVGGSGLTRTAVVTMADLGTLEVEVDVNEAYIARIRSAQPARITLDAYPETAFRGQTRQVVPTADRQKATVLVKVSMLERDPRILPEMSAKVEFLEKAAAQPQPFERPRVFVPAAAVRDEGGRQIVWIVRDRRLVRQEVDAGPVTGDLREVRKGLAGGEEVMVAGPPAPREGTRVRVRAPQ
ncbi:MAG: efflux RND transporter periplasmic adaptor subunit [Gemmatimonadetes bacterium]|nr:efflux RND transporter periplasmic adaptor subunit [Gemmatimonadota bacterium]